MPASVKRLPGERILIATMTGEVSIDDILGMYEESNKLIGEETGVFHRITDVRQATTSFPEMLKAIQRSTQEMPAASASRQIRVTFVGSSTWVDFIRNAFLARGIEMAAFQDMETALQSVRLRIASEDSAPTA